ncbi:MAG: MBL fold metallo-hydrolase [Clostridiales bacterium]|nr:MBL fold metallo-hydrolase [Clostridiales bacterium]
MIIKVLVENTSISKDFGSEHGLSLYIETKDKKILFDVGASDLYLKNAEKLNINIGDIDYLIISHGHYDHGGGLEAFLNINKKAKVYLHPLAFGKYYAQRLDNSFEYVGIDGKLKENSQIVFTSDQFYIDKGLEVFSNIHQKEPPPISNKGLLMEKEGKMLADSFSHEQNLIIEEDDKTLLVTGCAHNGIINIVEQFNTLKGRMPNYVIGGFHLSGSSGGNESLHGIEKIGKYLVNTKAQYYTCHCTGLEPFNQLKEIMGENIDYLSAGSEITI